MRRRIDGRSAQANLTTLVVGVVLVRLGLRCRRAPGGPLQFGRTVSGAIIAGAVSAALTVTLHWSLVSVSGLVAGDGELSGAIARATPSYDALPIAVRLILPAIGGLFGGLLIAKLAPEAAGEGVRTTRGAVSSGPGIRTRVVAVRVAATALCLGTGGSAGALGPLVHAGAAVGTGVARVLHASADSARLLIVAGPVAAISTLFGAPLAGICFAFEVLLVSATPRVFAIVVPAASVGVMFRWATLGTDPMLDVHADPMPAMAYLVAPCLGLLCALVAVAFVSLRNATEQSCLLASRVPRWLLPMVGGLLLGPVFLVAPQLWGAAYRTSRQLWRAATRCPCWPCWSSASSLPLA